MNQGQDGQLSHINIRVRTEGNKSRSKETERILGTEQPGQDSWIVQR